MAALLAAALISAEEQPILASDTRSLAGLTASDRTPEAPGLLWVDTDHEGASVHREQVAITADGAHVMASWWRVSERVQLYDLDAGGEPAWRMDTGDNTWFLPLDSDDEGRVLVCATRGDEAGEPPPVLYVWDRRSPAPIHAVEAEPGLIWVDAETCADGRFFVGLAQGPEPDFLGSVHGFETASGDPLWTFQMSEQPWGMDCSADGTRLAVLSSWKTDILDTTNGSLIDTVQHPAGSQALPALSGDGSLLVVGTTEGHVAVFSWNGDRYETSWIHQAAGAAYPPYVATVDVSDSGGVIMAGTLDFPAPDAYDGTCFIFNADSSLPTLVDHSFTDQVSQVVLTPDGSRGVAVSYGQLDGNAGPLFAAYDTAVPALVFTVDDGAEPGVGSAYAAAISADGRYAVFGGTRLHARQGGGGGYVAAIKLPTSYLLFIGKDGTASGEVFIGDRVVLRLADRDGHPYDSSAWNVDTVIHNEKTGDVETVQLVEITPESGIFEGGVPSAYNWEGSAAPGDGILQCSVGDKLLASYVDPGDPEDVASATAVSSWSRLIVTGPGPAPGNAALARTFDPFGRMTPGDGFLPFGGAGYGLAVAAGDLDGDGVAEIVTAPGPGPSLGPHVAAFSADGQPVAGVSFLAYGYRAYGVNAACGDVDGDGTDEIITGAGPGPAFGPHVRGWDGDGPSGATPVAGLSFLAYGTCSRGVNVACGDVDGDGMDEIITGAGPGGLYGPHVRGWNHDGSGVAVPVAGLSFLAYGTRGRGVNVACGDVDGDGMDEIITGAGPGFTFGPHVRCWNHDGGRWTVPVPGGSFFAYSGQARFGVSVAAGDVDLDGVDEILTAPGPDPASTCRVRGFALTTGGVAPLDYCDFDAYGGDIRSGGRLAAGRLR